jgi:RNA polymerase-binding protein DksA
MLSSEDLERYRKRLLEDRTNIEARIEARASELGSGSRADGGVGDQGDEARAIADREQAIDDNQLERELLGRIDKALSRIDAGTYGVSEISGKPIPKERLEALPTATTLVDEPAPEA